jgi:hypothetical protein
VTSVAIEIDYQPGAEPYVDGAMFASNPWDLFFHNARVLFGDDGRTIRIVQTRPMDLVDEALFSQGRITTLSSQHRDHLSTAERRTFHLLFLDGYFDKGDGQESRNILGVSLGASGVIAIFKPVIESTATSPLDTETPRLVEQTTVIHEFGHAVGLVNAGLPMASPHQDEEHGRHCTSEDCVMFWLNEQDPSAVVQFALRRITGASSTLFDEACLADGHAAAAPVQP